MAIYKLPFESIDPHYEFEIDLEGTRYVFVLDWNSRDEAWYLSLALPDGTQILDGRRVVLGSPVFRRLTHASRPLGDLIFLDTDGTSVEPGRNDLGGRVVGIYFDEADLPA